MKSLKLNVLEQNQLKNQEMNQLKGGNWLCTCSCYWANQGGSSTENNGIANGKLGPGGHSVQGDNQCTIPVISNK